MRYKTFSQELSDVHDNNVIEIMSKIPIEGHMIYKIIHEWSFHMNIKLAAALHLHRQILIGE